MCRVALIQYDLPNTNKPEPILSNYLFKEEINLKKTVSVLIIISLIVSLSMGLPSMTANAASLKKPKLQSFTTGAMEMLLTVTSVYDGVALAVEGDPEDRSGGYASHRVVLIDYETGKKTITPYDTPVNFDGVGGFVEGWAIVGKVGALKQNYGEIGYTFINTKGKSLSEPKYKNLTNFHNGLAGCNYFVGDEIYTGVLQTDGKVRFAILGDYDVKIGNNYVTMKEAKNEFTYDLKGNKITLTQEILDKDVTNYKAAERDSFYKEYASQYTKVDYLGSNRFRVEANGSRSIVDSKNKTIYEENSTAYYGLPRAFVNNDKLYLETSEGICNIDGKVIIPSSKYNEIRPADGDCFVTKTNDTFQMFNSSGKVVATSEYNPMIYLYQGKVDTLFVWLYDSEYRPNGVACLFTNINLSKGKSSTAELKKLYNKCTFPDEKSALGAKASAQKLMKSSTADNPGLFSVMSVLSRGYLKDLH